MCSADCRHGAGDGVRPQGQGQARRTFNGWRFFFWCPGFLRLPDTTFLSTPVSCPSPRFGGDHQRQRFCGFFLRFPSFPGVLVVLLPRFESGNESSKGHGGGGEFPHEGTHLRGGDAFGVDDAEGRHVGAVSSQVARVGGDGVLAASSFHAQVDEVLLDCSLERGLRLLVGSTQGRRTQHGRTGRRGHAEQTRAAECLAHRAFCLLHAISSVGSVDVWAS